MLHILQLFGRSPFAPLQGHMEKVTECVRQLKSLFSALKAKDYKHAEKIATHISELEHAADLIKNDIRNHLPTGLLLTIDRGNFLEMLQLQDSIADSVEDIAILVTLRPMQLLDNFAAIFETFLQKNIECFEACRKIILELHELLESSFGGKEAEKVKRLCDEVSFLEHEADLVQRPLLQGLYQAESEMTYGIFHQWQKIFEKTGALSNLSEKLASCIRMTLDIKQ
jgi:uncharacterized protein